MTPKEEIESLYQHVKETSTASGMYQELADEMEWSIQHMARTGELLAQAGEQEQLARAKAMKEQLEKDSKIGAMMLKGLVDAVTATEHSTTVLIERLNALLVHRVDVLRSQMSYIKSDLERSRYQAR